jgi:hypothetical protein
LKIRDRGVALDKIDGDSIQVWKVDLADDESLREYANQATHDTPKPTKKLLSFFPAKETVNIVVRCKTDLQNLTGDDQVKNLINFTFSHLYSLRQ